MEIAILLLVTLVALLLLICKLLWDRVSDLEKSLAEYKVSYRAVVKQRNTLLKLSKREE